MPLTLAILAHADLLFAKRVMLQTVDVLFGILFLVGLVLVLSMFRGPR
jgi:hypothetical protein